MKTYMMKVPQGIWKSIWRIIGAPPLWLKIMGIVIGPLIIVLSVLFLYVRREMFTLITETSSQELTEILLPLFTQRAVLALALTTAIGILLAFFLSRALAKPLQNMIKTIREIEKGDLSSRVDVWAEDEIGQLQVALNNMTERLERSHKALLQRNYELQVMNEIAETVALGKGVDSVLEAALDRVMQLLEADAGAIYLLDETNDTLEMKIVQGELVNDLTKHAKRVDVQHSPMQRVLESGEPLFLEDISQAHEFPSQISEILRREGFASWVCVPITAQAEVLGTICLSSRGEQALKPGYVQFLNAIGNVIGIGISNRQLIDSLALKEGLLRNALHRAVELQEEERKRLARELHDGTGQALTSILIRLRALDAEDDHDTLMDRLDGLRYLTAETLEELRRLSLDLRPAALDNLGIVPALRWFTKRSSDSSGLEIKLNSPDHLDRLPSEMEISLYRIAQEAITNAIRHAQATSIDIQLERGTHCLWLTIEDDGQGFEMENIDSGLGLVGIQERISLLNGIMKIDSTPDYGTKLWVEIPIPESIKSDA
jgi:signal transduction histidine kinase